MTKIYSSVLKQNKIVNVLVKLTLAFVFLITSYATSVAQCSVSVAVFDNGDGTSTLSASGSGQGTISYSWDGGAGSGSQFTVTNDGAQHCVSVDDYYYDANAIAGYDANGDPIYGDYVTDYACSSDCGTVAAAAAPPVANFTPDVTSGDAPLTVNFTDNSTNNPTSWAWDFGDGNTSTAQNPSNTFTTVGTYTVLLTVTNADGTDTYSVTITVNAPPAPTANFTPDVTSGNAPLTVNFTDNSTDSPTSWAWDFGDGNTSTSQNPSNTFTTPGTYTVSLIATNAIGSSTAYTVTITVNAPPAPTANFTPDVTSGDAPLTVNFTDNSTDSPTSWAWDFGDGNTSTAQNPSNTFTTPGTYTVSLVATNATGSSTAYTITITVNAIAPIAQFAADNYGGDAPLLVNFEDQSLNTPTSWLWDFGDGNTSTNPNPSNVYQTPGTYSVTLTVTNAIGTSTSSVTTITVNSATAQCIAQFTTDATSGDAPLTVSFDDTSTENPTTWSWEVDGVVVSTDQNLYYTFDSAGTYQVTLTVDNGNGSITSSTTTITVNASTIAPVADFTADVNSGEASLTVQFTDASTNNPTSWNWDFGNGDNSTDQNPSYTFNDTGVFTVRLTVDNGNGSDYKEYTITVIDAASDSIDFEADVYEGPAKLTVQFTDLSPNNPTAWAWDFGNGDVSSVQNPSYTFNDTGRFTVTLTITSANGSTHTDSVTITVTDPNDGVITFINDALTEDEIFVEGGRKKGRHSGKVIFQQSSKATGFTSQKPFKVCADGSSATIIKYKFPESCTTCANAADFAFRIQNSNATTSPELWGKFTMNTPPEDGVIEGRLTHPEYLDVNGVKKDDSVEVYNTITNTVIETRMISYYRAPVMMVHGLWSEAAAFAIMESDLVGTSNYFDAILHRVDYSTSNDQKFETNKNVVPNGITFLLKKAVDAGYSAGSVDVVGHSMGGILTRAYIQSSEFTTKKNNKKTDVRSLITLNTPHSGSQCGNLLRNAGFTKFILKFAGKDANAGAIEDLSVDGNGITNYLNGASLNANTVPSHCIVSTTPSASFNSLFGSTAFAIGGTLFGYKKLGETAREFHDRLFGQPESDLIVPLKSQTGGLSGSYLTSFDTLQQHVGSPDNTSFINEVIRLLDNNPTTSTDFTKLGFTPEVLTSTVGKLYNQQFSSQVNVTNQGLGTVKLKLPPVIAVNPGDTIPIEVSSTGNFPKIALLVGLKANDLQEMYYDSLSNHYKVNYTVPTNYVGKIKIAVAAHDSASYVTDSATLITDTKNLTLDSMHVYPKKIYIPLGSSFNTEVTGYFAGNGAVDITNMPGVAFTMGNTKVVSQINANIIKGIKKGKSFIRVAYKGKTRQVPVEVIDSVGTNGVQSIKNKGAIINNSTTGIDVKIYPNPASGLAYITYINTDASQHVQLDVYDMYGKLVRNVCNASQAVGGYTQLVDVSRLSNGLYYIRLQNGNKLGRAKLSVLN